MNHAMLQRLRPYLLPATNLLQRALLPLGLRATKRIKGRKITFDPATDIGMQLLATGCFEPDAMIQCATYLRPDSWVLDIGANIGVLAAQFADLTPQGKVICLEPARSTFELLLHNVDSLPNVIPLNVALSDRTGFENFFVASDNAYSGLKDTGRKRVVRQESVACFRADDLLLPLLTGPRLDLIKIDVEGFELQVLQGMAAVIEKHRPVIFCEIFGGEQSNPDPQATVAYCVSRGYDAFVLRQRQLVPVTVHDDRLHNYFFVPVQK